MVVLSIEPCRKSDKAVRTRLFKFKKSKVTRKIITTRAFKEESNAHQLGRDDAL